MIVYFGETVTAGAQGQAWRAQNCEHCGQQFYYRVEFAATGSATNHYFLDSHGSTQRAEEDAQRLLDHALRHEVVPVPCPHCTLYQRDMVSAVQAALFPEMRRAALLLLSLTPLPLLLGGAILGAGGFGAGPAAVAVMLGLPMLTMFAGIRLLVSRSQKQAAYDPNDDESSAMRRRVAAAFALKPEEFAQLQVAALAPRPQGQLVGCNCARCGQRISCELDGRFCQTCGSPVHNDCARSGESTGCPSCGAENTSH
jgi:hypothetical protein